MLKIGYSVAYIGKKSLYLKLSSEVYCLKFGTGAFQIIINAHIC